jgi:hypothetical protein
MAKNPNTSLMQKAGFKRLNILCSGDIETWGRGDLRVVIGRRLISLNKLIGYVINQAIYRARKSSQLRFGSVIIDNKGAVYDE